MSAKLPKDYAEKLREWRRQAEASLRGEYSWLALAGLFWLEEGENLAGSGADCKMRLPDRAPKRTGRFRLESGKVSFRPEPNVVVRLNEDELEGESPALKVDASGTPDFLFWEDIRMAIIERAENWAVRIWDPQNVARRNFRGRTWFEPDASYRVEARIEKYEPPKAVVVDDVVGILRKGEMHASLHFLLNGQSLKLDAERLEDDSFYIIFRDPTAGESTYPAGRYLVTEPAEGDRAVIDFNRAYNPPCAFTEFATCPLPQAENVLPVPVRAGETYHAG
jgi:uncharacterized protein (DUF1684 family)